MKAMTMTRYGSPDVFQLKDVAKPVPKANEVLIKIRATTVTSAECAMRKGQPVWGRLLIGLTKPRKKYSTLGIEFAGDIEAVGGNVTRFAKGDAVYGFAGFNVGTNAEYKCLPESGSIALKPANLTYEEAAAAVDGTTTALFFLRDKAQIQRGQSVLINGASGSIGTYAVQLAKHFGANVTGVCSGRNADLVYSLGADQVIDYTKTDFTDCRGQYDIIFDTIGKSTFRRCKRALKPQGVFLSTTGLITNMALSFWTSIKGGKQVKSGMSVNKNEGLVFIRELIETGQLKPVIDRQYPLEQLAEAHSYVETGRKRGNVVIAVS
jgi:NADPH:quinone reductase-like Zn-dependent oxidoreductase